MKTYEIIVEKTNTGYSAYTSDYPVATTGKTIEYLTQNMIDALTAHLEAEGDPKLIAADNLKIVIDIPQFFEFYSVINAAALSNRVGINKTLLSQYINGHKKPSSKQVNKILGGIKQLGRELSSLEFSPSLSKF